MHEVRIKIFKLSKNYMDPFLRNLLKEVFFFQIKGINQERKHQGRKLMREIKGSINGESYHINRPEDSILLNKFFPN